MADQILKTRIKLKYDTLANWGSKNPVLLAGEIAIATIPNANPANKELPPVMFKVGDGTSKFSQLEWASALAADVYGWAKAAVRPTYKYGDSDLTGFGTAAEKNVGDFDASGSAAAAEKNAKDYTDEKIAAIPAQAEFTLETGTTDGSLVLKKNGEVVGDAAVVKGWAELLAKAQKGVDDAVTAQSAAEKAQGDIDAYKTSNDAALAAVKATADAAQTSAQVDAKISVHNTATDAHEDIRQSVTALAEKVSGRATGYVFKNKDDTAYKTAIGKTGSFVIGDTIYFTDENIPDEWVTDVNTSTPYYTFQNIETEKPSFDGYVTGTELTADQIVLGGAGSAVKASGKKISTSIASNETENPNLVPTNSAVVGYVKGAIEGLDVASVSVGAGQTIKSIGESDGKISVETQDIKVDISQVTGLQTAIDGKQDKITADNKLASSLVSGLGIAASKNVDSVVGATSENLPTSKAVVDYVTGEIGKIEIPTVNNAALKDKAGNTIFTANASEDVVITIIDCGSASEVI